MQSAKQDVPPDPRNHWSSLDLAARDAAYDNNAAVVESPRWIEARNHDSRCYREAHPNFLDIPYGSSEREAIDLYPASNADAPCLVFIHGGYWQRNSRDVFACVAAGLGANAWSVAIPGYNLAPQKNLRGIVSEIGQALDWLASNGSEYGISGPIILAGWSAGAQLAACHLGHPRVAAGMAISGIYDLAPLRDTGLNRLLSLRDEEVREFSPVLLPPVSKPLLVAYGEAELPALVHDALNFHRMRDVAGVPGSLLPVVGADHFSILQELQKPDGELVQAAINLLSSL